MYNKQELVFLKVYSSSSSTVNYLSMKSVIAKMKLIKNPEENMFPTCIGIKFHA